MMTALVWWWYGGTFDGAGMQPCRAATLVLLFIILSTVAGFTPRQSPRLAMKEQSTIPLTSPATTPLLEAFLRARSACAETVTRRDAPADGALVKSLVWEADGVPLLLVLALDRVVDKAKLARHLGVGEASVGLVDRERAVALAGHQIGTIPPCGLLTPLRTVVDAALAPTDAPDSAASDDAVLYGGAGSLALQVRPTLL